MSRGVAPIFMSEDSFAMSEEDQKLAEMSEKLEMSYDELFEFFQHVEDNYISTYGEFDNAFNTKEWSIFGTYGYGYSAEFPSNYPYPDEEDVVQIKSAFPNKPVHVYVDEEQDTPLHEPSRLNPDSESGLTINNKDETKKNK